MKTITAALVALAASLPQAVDPASLQISIGVPTLEFKVGEPIDWTVTIQNVSSGPLRVIKPDWYFIGNKTPAPSAAFVIEREDGRIGRPIPMCIGDDIGDTADKIWVLVGPEAKLVTTVSMLRCWSYTFGSETIDPNAAFHNRSPFPAGRYKVSVTYGFATGAYSRRWWAFLGQRTRDNVVNAPPPLVVEEPWHGEVTSNAVSIVVR